MLPIIRGIIIIKIISGSDRHTHHKNHQNHSSRQETNGPMPNLNIAALCPATRALGPGKRFAVWVQGCPFDCPNCASPDWKPIRPAERISPEALAEKVLAVNDLEGITLSGGEPMLQAAGLLRFVRLIQKERRLSVICYTGFTLEALREKNDPVIKGLLSVIDVLVDGPYIDRLNDNKGWRGSSNQAVHFLTGRYEDRAMEFEGRRRDVEVHLRGDHYLLVGVRPMGFRVNV